MTVVQHYTLTALGLVSGLLTGLGFFVFLAALGHADWHTTFDIGVAVVALWWFSVKMWEAA